MLEMTSSVLQRDIMIQKGIFWTIDKHLYFVYHLIISYKRITVYRVERTDVGKISLTHWHQWNMKIQPSQ